MVNGVWQPPFPLFRSRFWRCKVDRKVDRARRWFQGEQD